MATKAEVLDVAHAPAAHVPVHAASGTSGLETVRTSVASNTGLRETLVDHRAPWLSSSLSWLGLEEWLNESLCYAFTWSCPEPPDFFESPGGVLFFWMLVFANAFVIILVISVVGALASHLVCDPTMVTLQRERQEVGATSLTVLLPCYLPNEEHIMLETIRHIIEELVYDYPFELVVCYNTPHKMAMEDTLRSMHGRVYPNGRRLSVLRVEHSRSKAENLNCALDSVATENVVIYDADHHPDRDSLLIASAAMRAHDVACIQGSTYLRSRPTLLAAYINAEFFVTHFVFFPAMQFVTGMGVRPPIPPPIPPPSWHSRHHAPHGDPSVIGCRSAGGPT